MEMLWLWRRSLFAVIIVAVGIAARPHRILLDTDVDSDDFFAMLYLLKLNKFQFDLQVRFLFFTYMHNQHTAFIFYVFGDFLRLSNDFSCYYIFF
ncbi:putative ribonucleoside hydrolase [Helianthus annuus]|uniref:Ribonucleoside hydrolase n=1 Tax=Helianthus annuus TaxID=4232 RepID=A0A9K3EIB4_HELAN|nr:putative ribonucleoside hydrolase [Helianthus annuus]KAJ0716028.1 putative ribonucleoside hydrolase [Helianthus annuus]KAJ0850052.1 putative ribonucleoside hydrolase [Helianthus annuus]